MKYCHLIFVALVLCSGCASTQINYNTLDIASTYDTLITKQVVFNLYKTFENQYSIPSLVKVTAQTAGTMDAVNPTFTTPFSAQNTIMQSAAAFTGRSLQFAAPGLSLQTQASWNQTYTLSPIDDPDELRRERSLYRYATGHLTTIEFESDYPIIQVSGSKTPTSPVKPTIVSGTFAGQKFDVLIGDAKDAPGASPTTKYVRPACTRQNIVGQCISFAWTPINPDKTFIVPPGCIMCDFGHQAKGEAPGVIGLEKNPQLVGIDGPTTCAPGKPFFYLPGEPLGEDAFSVPSNGIGDLRVRGQCGLQAFYELALFTQEAASQGTGSAASGGQSEGRKTEPLQRISLPVGPGSTNAP